MWPFKNKEVITWKQRIPTTQEEINKLKEWIENNETKMAIIQAYRKGPDEIKELISLEYSIYGYKKQIKKLTEQPPKAKT